MESIENTKGRVAAGDLRQDDWLPDHEREIADRDVIVGNYHTLLNELSLLTTVSVILFGFLLAAPADARSTAERWLLVVAMVAVATATLVFILPVVYHRLQFPYSDWKKFQLRSHGFISIGFPMLSAGIYLGLSLSIWDTFKAAAFLVAALPIVAALLIFLSRRQIS